MNKTEERNYKREVFLRTITIITSIFDVSTVAEIAGKVGDKKTSDLYYNIKMKRSTPTDADAQRLLNAFNEQRVFESLNEAFKVERNKAVLSVDHSTAIIHSRKVINKQKTQIKRLIGEIPERLLVDLPKP